MAIKKILALTLGTLLCSFTAMAPAFAARIYNTTDKRIWIVTVFRTERAGTSYWSPQTQFSIEPQDRSPSLNWSNTNQVLIYQSEDKPLQKSIYAEDEKFSDSPRVCNVSTGAYNHIQGGNYLIVEPGYNAERDRIVNCYICNASDKVIYGKGDCSKDVNYTTP